MDLDNKGEQIKQCRCNDDESNVMQQLDGSSPKRMCHNVFAAINKKPHPLLLLHQQDPTTGFDRIETCRQPNMEDIKIGRPCNLLAAHPSNEKMAPSRRPILLPQKDRNIGLDLMDVCKKPTDEFKRPFLPQKMDLDKIVDVFRKEGSGPRYKTGSKPAQSVVHPASKVPVINKNCRRKLFKRSKLSIRQSLRRCSQGERSSIIGKKSNAAKNMKPINGGLLDASVVEKKIFNMKSRGTFKLKSPSVTKQSKSPAVLQSKKATPKNPTKKPCAILAKKSCTPSYVEEMKSLLLADKTAFDNLRKELISFKNKQYETLMAAHEGRFDKVESLLQKINIANTHTESVVIKKKNETPIGLVGQNENLIVSALNQKVQLETLEVTRDARFDKINSALKKVNIAHTHVAENGTSERPAGLAENLGMSTLKKNVKFETVEVAHEGRSLQTFNIPHTSEQDKENGTPKRPAGLAENLRVPTLKKNVQFDVRVKKALDMYNSMKKNSDMLLLTPKINRGEIMFASPTPKDPIKLVSRRLQQQCLMLQDTPVKE